MKPISPAELRARRVDAIPAFVIEAVNNCLARAGGSGSTIVVKQDDIVAEILKLAPPGTLSREAVFENNLLDFEDTFRRVGWSVTYDKPAYCETYPATFEFRAKKGTRR